MLSIKTFKRLIQYQRKKESSKLEGIEYLVYPEQIELIRVEESNGNYHNNIIINPQKKYQKN